ncbi:adenosine receptor A3 isoform X1 [Centrocercus urophasianus]|uniref:adenosine receptor A3 isoform X1 n=1 Tax=Centrocercus urophasianus TaxID=9002 RepID=UPI001C64EBC1|nr:adenosine receptor A3 isoform X1 [Centrocercus urophasianus]
MCPPDCPASSSPTNGTLNTSQVMGSTDVIYIGTECLVALLAALGNIPVVWAVKLNAAFHNTTMYFIASLALADIAVGLVVIPLAVLVSLHVSIPFHFCLFLCCLMVVFTQASILSLLAIAIDRYLRVKLPIRYKIMSTERRIWWALGLCWSVSLLVGLTPMFGWNKRRSARYHTCEFISVMRMDYMVYFSFFTWTLIPLSTMCALYVAVFYIIRTKLSQGATNGRGVGVFYGKEFRKAKSLALVLFLFAVSWLPLCIMNCVFYFHPEYKIPKPWIFLGILLSHANSAINPIVYACKIKKFKTTYLLILRTYILCRKKPEARLSCNRLNTAAVIDTE